MKILYNKLVRDKMVDIYKIDVAKKERMNDYSVRYIEKVESLKELKAKLQEEVAELLEVYDQTDITKLQEEIADVLEVIHAISYYKNVTIEDIEALRKAKKEKRGGFETGLFLESIDYFDGKEPG